MVFAETYFELLRNGPHWAFELTVEVVTAAFMALPLRRIVRTAVRRHDEKKHGADVSNGSS